MYLFYYVFIYLLFIYYLFIIYYLLLLYIHLSIIPLLFHCIVVCTSCGATQVMVPVV